MNSTVFIALAAGVEEAQIAIASTGYYLAGNIGALIGASATSNILVLTLRPGLEKALEGIEERDVVRMAFRWWCIIGCTANCDIADYRESGVESRVC